jgi:hypothetical protein
VRVSTGSFAVSLDAMMFVVPGRLKAGMSLCRNI